MIPKPRVRRALCDNSEWLHQNNPSVSSCWKSMQALCADGGMWIYAFGGASTRSIVHWWSQLCIRRLASASVPRIKHRVTQAELRTRWTKWWRRRTKAIHGTPPWSPPSPQGWRILALVPVLAAVHVLPRPAPTATIASVAIIVSVAANVLAVHSRAPPVGELDHALPFTLLLVFGIGSS
jgi:hypothetical protein